jgi:hypothetical protein
MSRAQQVDQVALYLYAFCAVLVIIGMIVHGYAWARKSTPEPQRKHSKKVFLVLLAGLALISWTSLSIILGII